MKKLSTMQMSVATAFMALSIGVSAQTTGHEHHQEYEMPQEHKAAVKKVKGKGIVKQVKEDRLRLTVEHEPIAELNWPTMVMPFAVKDKTLLKGLQVGDQIIFELENGQVITSIQKFK